MKVVKKPGGRVKHLSPTGDETQVKVTLCGERIFYRYPPSAWDGRPANVCKRCAAKTQG